jgi:large subunit ribosomal protein L18
MQKNQTSNGKHKVRQKITGTAEKPRLAVFRSNNHIYAQLIDDMTGKTILASSTLDKSCFPNGKATSTCEASIIVGEQIAKKSLNANIQTVVFDRGGKIYHGRIKALANAAREKGLKF